MALDDDIALLSGVAPLSLFEREALRLLAFAVRSRRLAPGEVLFQPGEEADEAYVVRSGTIIVSTDIEPSSLDPKAPDIAARPGALIDELAMFVTTERSTRAQAREPSEVIPVTRELVLRVLNEFPDSAIRLRDRLAERLTGLTGAISHIGDRLEKLD